MPGSERHSLISGVSNFVSSYEMNNRKEDKSKETPTCANNACAIISCVAGTREISRRVSAGGLWGTVIASALAKTLVDIYQIKWGGNEKEKKKRKRKKEKEK